MNKKLVTLFCLAALVPGFRAQEKIPLISEIGLIESGGRAGTNAPRELIVGIESSRYLFYKLLESGTVIKGGQFLPGFNSFSIEIGDRFEHPGAYAYALVLKSGSLVIRKNFTLDIRIQESEIPKEESADEVVKHENIISMYIGERLIASNRKLYTSELTEKIKAIPRPYSIDPYDSAAEPSMKNTGGVPILGAVAAAADAIKALFSGKLEKESRRPIEKKRHITARFIRNDPDGKEISVTAAISLRLDRDFF